MHLAGKAAAARFVEGRAYEVVEPQAPLRRAPSPEATLDMARRDRAHPRGGKRDHRLAAA
jgi:hypothetical protein